MYAIHPGWIISRTDGDRHYIGIAQLVRLYKLNHNEYIVWKDNYGYRYEDYVHLYPSYHGNYGKPI